MPFAADHDRRLGDVDTQRIEQRGHALIFLKIEENERLTVAREEFAEPMSVA